MSIRDDMLWMGHRCYNALFGKIRPFCWFSTICCNSSSCHMTRRVVLAFVWYWGMIEEILKFVFALPIHSPQGRDSSSIQVWKSEMTCYERVMCASERYWASSGNFADFQQTVSLFSHVSCQEQSFLLLFIISLIWGGSDWRWAILRKLTMVLLI